jgi:hypothetical protein
VARRNPEFKDLRCMNFTSKGTREILIAGCQEQMFKVDVEKGTVTEAVSLHRMKMRTTADLGASCTLTPNIPS